MLNSMLGPHLSPNLTTGVPHDSPLEGQSPWDLALITPGKARRRLIILFWSSREKAVCITYQSASQAHLPMVQDRE